MHGADLTRRLLAFARRQPLQAVSLDVNERITGISKLLGRLLGEAMEIELRCLPDLWRIVADPAQLEAAITNLATNARDAMPKGGRLTIATYNRHLDRDGMPPHLGLAPGDYVVIEASDTGVGMPPEIVRRVFEPFFTTKPQGKGTGLGLSMVFGFVKQSGGHVAIDSTPGEGTTFRLYFPRNDGDASAPGKEQRQRDAPRGIETILVVEDNAGIRELVVRQLVQLGYRVVEADNARTALHRIDGAGPIDLLFTDVVMPGGLDGFDLAQIATARRPGLKVLFTSGFTEAGEADCAAVVPGSRLLRKPYRKDELARMLRAVLGGAAEGAAPDAP
jgi:CheY-like chemotaxis protein